MMGIDWDAVVLSPITDVFAVGQSDGQSDGSVTFTPLVSQPGQPAYTGRAVWEVRPYTIIEENQAPLVTTIQKIGLRLNDFVVAPTKGDLVTINGAVYKLDTYEYDGQGGVRWVVKSSAPNQETQNGSQA